MPHDRHKIADALGVTPEFDVAMEVRVRIEFLAQYLSKSSCRTYVLGISGGVDSLAAGLLAQAAVSQLRAEGKAAQFIAVRLPYGAQADEADARNALDVIKPDRTVTVDIKVAADDMMRAVSHQADDLFDPVRKDFHLGNIKARQRMIAQYALAGASQGLVIGTDQAAEALMGFFTKFGDGAADILPLSGLTKRQGEGCGSTYGSARKSRVQSTNS